MLLSPTVQNLYPGSEGSLRGGSNPQRDGQARKGKLTGLPDLLSVKPSFQGPFAALDMLASPQAEDRCP